VSRSDEARLLYDLLAAAEEEQRLLGSSALERWLALKRRFTQTRPDRVHAALRTLFEDLERAEIFTGTWIEFRWTRAKSQREQQSAVRSSSRSVAQ
jgi:hypothetical protein